MDVRYFLRYLILAGEENKSSSPSPRFQRDSVVNELSLSFAQSKIASKEAISKI